jgi:hypothetical protein
MSTRLEHSPTSAVVRRDGDIVMTMSPRQAKLLAASIWLCDIGDADHLTWLDTVAEDLSDAANGYGSIVRSSANPIAALTEAVQRENDVEVQTATLVKAAADQAAMIAERAVLAAADLAQAAALAAQQARMTATAKTADVMAEAVRQQVLAAHDHANAEAREVAAAAARAASRVASAVVPGREAEARKAAVFVAQMTTDAAAATAEETALVAAAAARAAATAALDAAAEAADAAMLIELEVHSIAKAIQDTADAAAQQVAAETRKALALINSQHYVGLG